MKNRSLSHSLLFFLFFFAFAMVWHRTLREIDVAWVEEPREANQRVSANFIRAISAGHLPSIVNALWMRGMLDPSISHVREGNHAAMFYDLILAIDLDPAFYEAYLHGGNLLAVVRDDDQGALEILKRGEEFRKEKLASYGEEFRERFWKNAWAVPLALAYVQLYEVENLPGASEAFRAAAEIPGSPSYLKSLSSRLATVEGQYDVGIKLSGFLETSSNNPELKEGFREKRFDLVLGEFLYRANSAMKQAIAEERAAAKAQSVDWVRARWFTLCQKTGISGDRNCSLDPLGNPLSFASGGRIGTTAARKSAFRMEY